MKRYHDYMDGVEASDTLHQRLTELEPPQMRPVAWKKYGAAAAALVLAAGVGAYGLSQGGWSALMENFRPAATVIPEIADVPAPYPAPDIAIEDPNGPFVDPIPPGARTDGGYELRLGEGPDSMVAYFLLPYLEWADASAQPQTAMDYELAAPGAIDREAVWDDVLMFTGGEKAMADHLLWDGLDWGGRLWFADEPTPCAASLHADGNSIALFLEVMKGSKVPSCVVLPKEYYETSQWQDVKITTLKNGGYMVTDGGVELREKREVSLYSNGVGYKLTLYADDAARADELCARFVRYAVDGGFHLYALSDEPIYEEDMPNEDGGLPDKGFPPETMPTANILHPGDPGYVEPFPAPDGVPDEDSDAEGFICDCPYCIAGVDHTHPYDPGAHN